MKSGLQNLSIDNVAYCTEQAYKESSKLHLDIEQSELQWLLNEVECSKRPNPSVVTCRTLRLAFNSSIIRFLQLLHDTPVLYIALDPASTHRSIGEAASHKADESDIPVFVAALSHGRVVSAWYAIFLALPCLPDRMAGWRWLLCSSSASALRWDEANSWVLPWLVLGSQCFPDSV